MDFKIRKMDAADHGAWMEMRGDLWPDESPSAHLRSIEAILSGDDAWGFLAESADGTHAAFAEVSIRKYANGCDSMPVPFLEGIFVRPQFRRHGAGAGLIAYIEAFLAARGFSELGSDALIDNHDSHAAHRGWGFSETERVVYFRKALKSSSGAERPRETEATEAAAVVFDPGAPG
jgi:aminoglycoside 6'-N-acetyltransferase I